MRGDASGNTALGGAIYIELNIAAGVVGYIDSTGILSEAGVFVGADPAVYGGGTNVLGFRDAGTAVTTASAVGTLIQSYGGALNIYPKNAAYPAFVATATAINFGFSGAGSSSTEHTLASLSFNSGTVQMLWGSIGTTNSNSFLLANTITPNTGSSGGSLTLQAQGGDGVSTNGGDLILGPGNNGGAGTGTSGKTKFTTAITTASASTGSYAIPTAAAFWTVYVNNTSYKIPLLNP